MPTLKYKLKVLPCPACGKKLKGEFPRIGPSAVVCGHCGQTVRTFLPAWGQLTGWQKFKVAVGEILAPRSHGEMGCLTGLLTWLVSPLCVFVPLALIAMSFESTKMLLAADDPVGSVILPLIVVVTWLSVPAFRIGMLVRKARESSGLALPTWRA